MGFIRSYPNRFNLKNQEGQCDRCAQNEQHKKFTIRSMHMTFNIQQKKKHATALIQYDDGEHVVN